MTFAARLMRHGALYGPVCHLCGSVGRPADLKGRRTKRCTPTHFEFLIDYYQLPKVNFPVRSRFIDYFTVHYTL